jgi:hypothetical protein
MKTLVRFWREMTTRPVRQAFGLAPQDKAWALVGLSRQGADGVRVQAHTVVQPPDPLADVQVHAQVWRQALMAVAQPSGRLGEYSERPSGGRSAWTVQNRDQRLQLAWPADRVVTGQIEFPLDWPDDDCTAEVQLVVAQALNLPPEEVNFDWQVQPGGDGLVRQVVWAGCAREELAEFKRHIRAARWALAAVEPETQAAQRAARALQGGLPSLLTRPTQDWLFSLKPEHATQVGPDTALAAAVQQALFSPAGPRLVACGLALRAWL